MPVYILKIKAIINSLSKQKSDPGEFTGKLYQTSKEKIISIFYISEERNREYFFTHSMRPTFIALVSKPDKDIIREL